MCEDQFQEKKCQIIDNCGSITRYTEYDRPGFYASLSKNYIRIIYHDGDCPGRGSKLFMGFYGVIIRRRKNVNILGYAGFPPGTILFFIIAFIFSLSLNVIETIVSFAIIYLFILLISISAKRDLIKLKEFIKDIFKTTNTHRN